MFLIGGALIGIAGADRHLDIEAGHQVEEGGHALGIGVVEHGAVHLHTEAARLGQMDRFDSNVIGAGLIDGLVVRLLIAIEVDRPGEEGMRLVFVDLLFQQQGVGAQNDELLAVEIAAHDLGHVAMEQWLAAGDGDGGGAAFLDGVHALLHRQAAVEDGVGIVDLAAAGAGEIAAQQRFQHQHQRIFSALELVDHGMRANAKGGGNRN